MINFENNMENPALEYTTGTPMSQKGNLIQNEHGYVNGETLIDPSISSINDHDYPNNSHLDLSDSTSENVECITNSIQNGFQSEILCDFVGDVGLPSDVIRLENGLEVESVSNCNIKFPDSPESPFPIKISSFGSIEGFVPCFDEHLDNYLITEFKTENQSDSHEDANYSEEESKNVTEAISEIAKSFGLEDLLPENFQNGSSTNTTVDDDMCGNNDSNMGDISLGDLEKCSALHSPTSSLDLAEQFSKDVQNYELSCLDILASKQVCDSLENASQKDDTAAFINTEVNLSSENQTLEIFRSKNTEQSYENNAIVLDGQTSDSPIPSTDTVQEELEDNVPQMQIPDILEPTNISESCPSSGTVLITRDKSSNKMQIVLTLEQGQQVYDIDTDSGDINEHALGLELQNALNSEPFQSAEMNSLELSGISANETEISTSLLLEENNQSIEDEVMFEPSSFMQVIRTIPITTLANSKSHKKTKCFVCPVPECGQILDKECKLKVHMFSHSTDTRPFKCSFDGCDWAFTTPYRLRRHEETHLGSKEYICDFEGCNRKFTTIYNLKTHTKQHKWANSLTCPAKDCQLSFANRRKLELHLRIHKDVEAPYKCELCGKQYYSANCIASHLRTHQYNEDDFKCPFQGCGKVYDKICRLKQHIRHHTGDRPYICPADGCKWSFMSASKLTRHMRKHTGERKFVCTEPGCGKSFMRPEHLKGHIVIHSGDKPFHCPHENCNARFTAKSSLYVHVKKHCPSVLKVVYPCPVTPCVKKYNNKATLRQHLLKFHPDKMGDGKELNIAEKLELTMPVSLVSQNSDASKILEIEESITDDPASNMNGQLPSDCSAGSSISSEILSNSVPKQPKSRSQNRNKVTIKLANNKNTTTELKRRESNSRFIKLFQKNKNGCARTDIYCSYLIDSKNIEQSPSYVLFNQNNYDTQDSKSYSNQLNTEVKSPDVMLGSSLIFQDQTSDQFLKSSFLPDDCSNGLYHEDSLLISSSAFEAELIPVSLLSDSVESDESVLIDSSSVIFSEQNSVDNFIEPISLHGLE
ncbi:zinc finger protein 624 [Parasteatoda tepidariorum]|uniref:zinc finger protein 624 n=1 Tax=Parasteatoda tepidariorum TaxID=114398 RepID=UPI00077FDF74|nr:uncharacterized protein LOC107448967 [Parasteatoda tepidariorum]